MRTTRAQLAALLATVVAVTTITGGLAPMGARASGGWTHTSIAAYEMGDVGPMLAMLFLGTAPCPGGEFGTVCFGHTMGDTFTVKLEDDSGRKVGGIAVVEGSDGSTALHRPFCGSTGPLRVVPGELRVHLDAPGDVRGAHWAGGPGCTEVRPRPLGGGTGSTTKGVTSGEVHVTFTGSDS